MSHDPRLEPAPPRHRAGGHGWMMILCCIPMLVVAGVLVAAGVVSASFLLYAIACTAMMALMMRAMSGGAHGHGDQHGR